MYMRYTQGQNEDYRRAGNFREVIFSLYSRIVQIRETLTAKISTDVH